MKQKTYEELERELVDSKKRIKKLRERASTLRSQLIDTKRYMKVLIGQYERIIKEWRGVAEEYKKNLAKFFIVSVLTRIKSKLRR